MTASVIAMHQPNPDAMREHLEHLFGGFLPGVSDGLIELAWTDSYPSEDGRYKLRHARLFGTDQIEELIEEAVRVNSQPMVNAYVGAALRKPNTAPFGRTRDPDFYALTCMYGDLDEEDANKSARHKFAPAPPSFVVRTGDHPHMRHQVWWRLEEPITDPLQAEALIKGAAVKLNGDVSVSNPGRVMRLAGSIAWGQKPGRITEVTKIIPLRNRERDVYPLEMLERFYPPSRDIIRREPRERNARGPDNGIVRQLNTFGHETEKVIDGRERHMVKVICAGLIDYVGENGAAPSAEELFDLAWPIYERTTDLTRAGRGEAEFRSKCAYTVRRFEREEIRGLETLDKVVEAYEKKAAERPFGEQPTAHTEPVATSEPFAVGDFQGEPPPRKWTVPEWIPEGVVSALYGDGGMGKTLLAQQLLYSTGVGGKWLGFDVPKLAGLGVFCEDDQDELHRRHNAVAASLNLPFGQRLDRTWVWPRVGFDNLLVAFTADGKPAMTPFFEEVKRQVLSKRIELLILDTAADLYGGNEIIRGQVNFFVKAVCGGFIREAKEAGWTLTVLLLAHPSQSGKTSGSGESGSTGWNNAVRARLYLTRPENAHRDERVLTRKKSNYSASGDDVKLELLWSNGVLTLPGSAHPETQFAAAVEKCKHYVMTSVQNAWMSGKPYTGKPKHERHLETRMLEDCRHIPAPTDAMIVALRDLKDAEQITLGRTSDARGWRVEGQK
jgi:hypothetical protein